MVRRVVEEDVATPTTVVEDDGSWVGRTIVTLVILALLVVGAVWLVRSLNDDGNGVDQTPTEQNDTTNQDQQQQPDTSNDQPVPTSIPS